MSSAASAQQVGSAWSANEDDFLLLQMSVGQFKLSNDIRGYRTDHGMCLDLADVIQSLDLPIRLDKKSRRATGWLFSEDRRFTLDRATGTVQKVNTSGVSNSASVTGDIYDTPEGWCVDTMALGRWFGIDLTPDLRNASIKLSTDEKLPFIEALERKSRAARLRPKRQAFDLRKFPSADMEYKVWRAPSVDAIVQVGYDQPSAGQAKRRTRAELYAAGELAGASYTARAATDERLNPSSVRLRAYRYDRDGGLLGPLDATQVAVGDVETLSGQLTGQTAVGRGLFVSNRPLGRDSRFSATTLRGTLPAGWDAELYRNGQLVAFQGDSDDGRYEFADIDLFYGRNELEVVLYGPQGQVRREKADIPVGFNHVEPGKTYYWAGLLQKNRDVIELGSNSVVDPSIGRWRWGVGLERGLDRRTSVALGVQSLYFAGKRREYAEARILRTLGSAQAELAAAHERGSGFVLQGNGAARLGPLNLGAQAIWTSGSYASEFVSPNLAYAASLQADTSLRLGTFSLPLQAGLGFTKTRDGGHVAEWLIASAINTRFVALTAQLEGRREYDARSDRVRNEADLRLLGNTRIAGVRLRGAANFTVMGPQKGFDSAQISVNEDLDEVSELRAEAEYHARAGKTRFRLGYARRFERFALRADAIYSTDGSIGAGLSLSFSLGPDPTGGIRFSEAKLARFGQAAVTVFRDENGDGVFGNDEEAIPDVHVEAGFRTSDAVTDESGRTIVDQLKPFVPVLVGIDESSLPDPFLVPASKGVVVTPRPGIAAEVLIPLSPSGEVEGMLQRATGTAAAGVTLELIDAHGTVVASTLSEYDGFFLFERVAYGRYTMRIAADSARALGVESELGVAVTLNRKNDLFRAGVVKLRPTGRTSVARGAKAEPGA